MINVYPAAINFLSIEVLVSNNLLTCPPVSSHLPALYLISFYQTAISSPLSQFNLHLVHLTILPSLSLSFYLQKVSPTIPEANLVIQEHWRWWAELSTGELTSASRNPIWGWYWQHLAQVQASTLCLQSIYFFHLRSLLLDVSSHLGLLRRLGSSWRSGTWPDSGQSARILPQSGSHFVNFVTLLSLPFGG